MLFSYLWSLLLTYPDIETNVGSKVVTCNLQFNDTFIFTSFLPVQKRLDYTV
jgi:hypothetical protein